MNSASEILLWFASYRYIEPGDLQSIVTILIGLNIAPPLFFDVITRQARSLVSINEDITKAYLGLRDANNKTLPLIGLLTGEDVTNLTTSMNKQLDVTEKINNSVIAYFEMLNIYENQKYKLFPKLVFYAVMQFGLLILISVFSKVLISSLMFLGLAIVLAGTAWTACAAVYQYTSFVRGIQRLEEMRRQQMRLFLDLLQLIAKASSDALEADSRKKTDKQMTDPSLAS
jgi:hypothetical protein